MELRVRFLAFIIPFALALIRRLALSRGWQLRSLTGARTLSMEMYEELPPCIGNIIGAVKNVASTIRSYLHFSVPDVGPLTDYESWMSDFMAGLAEGIEKSKGMVAKEVQGVATDMVISPSAMVQPVSITEGTTHSQTGNILTELREALSELKVGSEESIFIPVYLRGTLLDEVVSAQKRQNMRSGGR